MSALELIKQGIAEGDMQKISKGYQMMTGEKIEPTKISDEHVQKLKAVFSDLQGSAPLTEEPAPAEEEPLLPLDSYVEETETLEEEPVNEDEEQKLFSSEVLVDEGASLANPVEEPVKTLIIPGKTMAAKSNVSLVLGEQLLEDTTSNDGGSGARKCTTVPFQIKKRANKFRDNLAVASKDLIFDKKVRSEDSKEAHKYIEKRPPDNGVVVTCRSCNRKFRVSSKEMPIRFDSSDNMNYECNSCVVRKKGSS